MKDAAVRILELPPAPPSRLPASKEFIDLALGEGDLIATEIADRLALLEAPHTPADPDGLKSAIHLSHRSTGRLTAISRFGNGFM